MRGLLLAMAVSVAGVAVDAPRPRLTADAVFHDFGRVAADGQVSHRFKLGNSGAAPLNIGRVRHSCGCTSTLLGKQILAPGESTELEVGFNGLGQSGLVTKTVTVESNDPVSPAVVLTFQADLPGDVKAIPDQVLFQDLQPGARRKLSVKLVSSQGRPIRVGSVDLSEAPWLGVATREEQDAAYVDLDLRAAHLPMGKLAGTDTIALHLFSPSASIVHLDVRWEKRARITAKPAKVVWAQAAGQPLAAWVTVSQHGGQPFRILSARTSNPLVQVLELPVVSASRHRFRVVLGEAATPGHYDEKVTLSLDAADQPELELRVSALLR